MIDYIKERIEYYETMERCFSKDVIDDLKFICNSLSRDNAIDNMTDEETKALEYLRSLKVRWIHLLKWRKIVDKAILLWFNQ